MSRHRWLRLLATYRSHRRVYDGRATKSAYLPKEDLNKDNGRTMTCVGLNALPNYTPMDISKVTLVGNTRSSPGDSQQDSPGGESSYHQGTTYNQLTAIKQFAFQNSTNIRELVLQGNRIKAVHPDALASLSHLRSLKLPNNRIKLLMDKSLDGLPMLEELDLSGNHMKTLPRNVFQSLTGLKRLHLYSNRLRGLHRKLFSFMQELQYLDLSDNHFRDFPKDLFLGCSKLETLVLDRNHLHSIRSDWFMSSPDITVLSVAANRIKTITHSTFSHLSNLKTLNLDKNELSHLTRGCLSGLGSLETLNLQRNNISEIDSHVFEDVKTLTRLDLSSNQIKMLTEWTFSGLVDLHSLSLSNNKLLDIMDRDLKMCTKLAKIDLSHNFLKTIRTRQFYGLLELRELRLDHNDIRVIEEEGFSVSMVNTYSKLTWLYLHFNQISTLSERSLSGLSYVKFLNLAHNQLSYVEPGGLAILRRLHTLLLNNNNLANIIPGTFKQVRYLQHLNLANNQLYHLSPSTLQGLDRLEDLNLNSNSLTELPVSILSDTPRLMSLDLTRNKLRELDMSVLDTMPRMKYLDLSKNGISRVVMSAGTEASLFFFSLSDNNLRTLKLDVMKFMSPNSALHLYGNPWVCDCELQWLKSRQWGVKVTLPDQEEIVCKAPGNVAGEQLMSLHDDEFRCGYNDVSPYNNWGADGGWRYQNDGSSVTSQNDEKPQQQSRLCGFLEHAKSETNLHHAKLSKGNLTQFSVIFIDSNNATVCQGVVLSPDWVLTSSQCWKRGAPRGTLNLLHGEDYQRIPIHVSRIVHYPGSLDLSLVSLSYELSPIDDGTPLEDQRIYPCILDEDGWTHVQTQTNNAVITSLTYKAKSHKLKSHAIPAVIAPPSDCPDKGLCLEQSQVKLEKIKETAQSLPVFVKVGRTKWALAGIIEHPASHRSIKKIHPAEMWITNTISS